MAIYLNEEKLPEIVCPHCLEKNKIDISLWKNDVTKLAQDKCQHCGGTVVCGLLIISDKTVKGVLKSIEGMILIYNEHRRNV